MILAISPFRKGLLTATASGQNPKEMPGVCGLENEKPKRIPGQDVRAYRHQSERSLGQAVEKADPFGLPI